MLLFLLYLSAPSMASTSTEKYCPHGEELIGDYCYLRIKSIATYEEARGKCGDLKMSLPDVAEDSVVGWMSDYKSDSFSSYCIYGYPNPLGMRTVTRQKYGITKCSQSLTLYCVTSQQPCNGNDVEITVNEEKKCVHKSESRVVADDCTTFDFDIRGDNVTYGTGEAILMDAHWTSYTLKDRITAESITGEQDITVKDVTNACFFKTTGQDPELRSCDDSAAEFMCRGGNPVEIWPDTPTNVQPDLGDDLVCNNTNDTLCGQNCYSNRTKYLTKAAAEEDCKKAGYVLAEHNVTECVKHNGWVQGVLAGGKIKGNQPTAPMCAFISNSAGKVDLGDCRRRTLALCYKLTDGNCEATEKECELGDDKACLSASRYAIAGREAGMSQLALCSSESLHSGWILGIGNKEVFKKCKQKIGEVVESSGPLWVASQFLGSQLAFLNTENITESEMVSSTQQYCVRKQGDLLIRSECDTEHYYTCQQTAKKRSKKTEIAVVVVLIVVPVLITILIIFLLYQQKGSKLCFSRPVVAVDTNNQIWLNPICEDKEKGRRNTDRHDSGGSAK